ncbi:root hair specific 17 [Prunus dulcis]|uniref:O-fucosyltransferase family protein n=1 Tax=Prunus dulcis TaxID=3755 RepID=A0A5H2XTV8_PRUDU|nr:root hair specific 17 [Prunus dulcis]
MTSLLIYKTNALNVAAADVKTYLLTAISGGLNQQRRGITDALVAAYILNATLLVLKLGQNYFGRIPDWFISSLSKDVEIIKQLPTKGGIPMSPYSMRVPRKGNAKCYRIKTCFLKGLISWVIRLVAFNLGYLPGGDKTIIRVRNNTEQGIGSCKKDVVPGGLISLVVYVGHPGGWQTTLTRYEVNINHSQGKVLPSIIMAKPAGGPSKRDQHAGWMRTNLRKKNILQFKLCKCHSPVTMDTWYALVGITFNEVETLLLEQMAIDIRYNSNIRPIHVH